MSLLPIHKTGEATETKKKLKKKGENQEAENVQENTKDTVAVKKKKKGKAAKRYYICFKKEFHHEDFSMGILVYVSMCICKRRISNHKAPGGR